MPTAKNTRMVSAVLVLAALLLLLAPWVSVTGQYRSQFKLSMKSAVESFDSESLSDLAEETGMSRSALKSMRGVMVKLEDGALSPFEAAAMVPGLKNFLKMYDEMSSGLADDGGSGTSGTRAGMTMYAVVFWVLAAAGALAVYCEYAGKSRVPALVFAIGCGLLLVGFAIGKNRAMSSIEDSVGMMDETLGVSLTFWAFAAVALAAAGVVFSRKTAASGAAAYAAPAFAAAGAPAVNTAVNTAAAGTPAAAFQPAFSLNTPAAPAAAPAAAAPAAGWVCPACGAAMGADAAFCMRCGAKRPAPAVCKNCGAALKPGAAFCTVCGTKQ